MKKTKKYLGTIRNFDLNKNAFSKLEKGLLMLLDNKHKAKSGETIYDPLLDKVIPTKLGETIRDPIWGNVILVAPFLFDKMEELLDIVCGHKKGKLDGKDLNLICVPFLTDKCLYLGNPNRTKTEEWVRIELAESVEV